MPSEHKRNRSALADQANRNGKILKPSKLALAVLTAFSLSSPLYAQVENTTNPEVEVVLDEVIVTGSRIRHSNIVTPIPTQILDQQEIEAAGTFDLGELIEQIPGVFQGLSPASTTLSTQTSGLSTIDLRSLGSNRTLTLINGRRVVSNSGNAQRVDTGTIPTGIIDRIDITTGGASAVYGSDAISGVANIVFKDDFDGLIADVRLGDTDEGGGAEEQFNLTWGKNFNDGRGNFMVGFMYENRDAVFASQREYARPNLQIDPETGELSSDNSSTLPGGRFEVGDAWNINGVWQNDQVGSEFCIDDGRVPACDDFQNALDGYNFRPLSNVRPSRERASLILQTKYELNDTTTGKILFQHADIDTKSVRAAANLNDASLFGPFDNQQRIGDIPADNPFIHPAVRETLRGTVDWRRRTDEVGRRDRSSNRQTTRLGLTLDGKFSENWNWEAYFGYGEFDQDQVKNNELNRQNAQFAINVEADPNNPGGFRCIDAGARAAGCVPLNVFGVGSISPEAANYIRHNSKVDQLLTQTTASFSTNGELWELPAGNVQVAMGLDYREETQETRGDAIGNAGLSTTSTLIDFDAEYDVTEAFVEFNVPLIHDRPGIRSLDFATAFRAADYSTVGSVSSWNFGLSYSPSDSIRFRGQISQAQRAPDIAELFSPLRSDFDNLRDPCDGVTAASTGIVADNCRRDPGILATIATEGSFQQDGDSTFGPNIGNLQLKEETADTTTFGFAYSPNDRLVFIADYYKIEVEDAIASVNTQLAADLCYNNGDFDTNRFCRSITRRNDGQVSRVINQDENLNSLTSEGVDVELSYKFSDEWKAKLLYTRILTLEENFDGPNGPEIDDFAGEVGTPENDARFTLTWKPNDAWNIRYRLKYTGSVRDNNAGDPDDFIGLARFSSVLFHDLYASYTIDGDHKYRIYAGINNIGDEHGPYLPEGYANGENSNVDSSYDVVGRRFYAGVRFNW